MSHIFSGAQSGVKFSSRTLCRSVICRPRTDKATFMFQNPLCLPGFSPVPTVIGQKNRNCNIFVTSVYHVCHTVLLILPQ